MLMNNEDLKTDESQVVVDQEQQQDVSAQQSEPGQSKTQDVVDQTADQEKQDQHAKETIESITSQNADPAGDDQKQTETQTQVQEVQEVPTDDKLIAVLDQLNETSSWNLALNVVIFTALLINLFFVGLKAGK